MNCKLHWLNIRCRSEKLRLNSFYFQTFLSKARSPRGSWLLTFRGEVTVLRGNIGCITLPLQQNKEEPLKMWVHGPLVAKERHDSCSRSVTPAGVSAPDLSQQMRQNTSGQRNVGERTKPLCVKVIFTDSAYELCAGKYAQRRKTTNIVCKYL